MDIEEFQRRLRQDYNRDVGLPQPYNFIDGNPAEPVVPQEVATHGVFILGAYPTASFATRQGVRYVPIDNVAQPFDPSTVSGKELNEHYLQKMGIERSQCWITNLVRTFLFKQGHVEKYMHLGYIDLPPANRGNFETYAASAKNMEWLQLELALAQPRLLITLGAEVAGILHGVKSPARRNDLLKRKLHKCTIGGHQYDCFHLAHPGIVMRSGWTRNPWPALHIEHCAAVRTKLQELL